MNTMDIVNKMTPNQGYTAEMLAKMVGVAIDTAKGQLRSAEYGGEVVKTRVQGSSRIMYKLSPTAAMRRAGL